MTKSTAEKRTNNLADDNMVIWITLIEKETRHSAENHVEIGGAAVQIGPMAGE
jgi:hypothetical protein